MILRPLVIALLGAAGGGLVTVGGVALLVVALLVIALLVVTLLVVAGLGGLVVGSGLARLGGLVVGSGLAWLGTLVIGSGLAGTHRLASGLIPGLAGLCSLTIGSRLTGAYGLTSRLARLYSLAIGSRLTGTHRLARLHPWLARLHPWLARLTPRLAGLYSLTIGSGLTRMYRLASRLARLHPWLARLHPWLTGLYSLAITSRLTRTHSRSIGSRLTARNALSVSGVTAGPATLGSLPICSLPVCALAPVLIIKRPCLHPLAEGSRLSASYSAFRVFYSFRPGILRFPVANLILARRTALTGPMLRSILRLRSGLCFLPIRSVLRFSVPGRLALFQTVCLQNRRNIGHNRRYPGLLKRRGRRIRLAAVNRTPSGYLLAAVQFIVVIIHLNFLLSLTGTEIPAFSNTPSTGYADSESRLQKIRAALRTQRCFETAAYVPTKRNIISPSAHSISYLTKKYNPPEFPDELHFPKRLLSILRSVQTCARRFRTWEQRLPRIYSP